MWTISRELKVLQYIPTQRGSGVLFSSNKGKITINQDSQPLGPVSRYTAAGVLYENPNQQHILQVLQQLLDLDRVQRDFGLLAKHVTFV